MQRSPRFALHTSLLWMFCLAACGGQSCSCLGPIKGGFPTDGRRHENAMQLRVTGAAVDYLEQNTATLLTSLLPGGQTFNVPPSCGGANEVCCGNPAPMCRLDIKVQKSTMTLTPPSVLRFVVSTQLVSKDKLPIHIGTINADCYVDIDTTKGTQGFTDIDLSSNVTFALDGTTDLTRITLVGTSVDHLDASMLDITPQSGIGNLIACGALNLSFIKSFVIDQLKTSLTDQITSAAEDAFCAKCTTKDDCDAFADGCSDGKCQRQGKCLQEIGAVGKLDVGGLFGNLSPGTKASMDTLAVLGGYADVTPTQTPGISLGLLGGGQADPHNTCVPVRPAPVVPQVSKWTAYTGAVEPRDMKPYHLAIGVHESHLNTMAWSAFDSGALCLNIGTPAVAMLSSKTVAVLMPSLNDLTHGENAPMYLVMRPQQEPSLKIGPGTFDVDMSGNKKIREPLLNVTVPKFAIDFYAFVDERYVRVMTLTADVALGAALDIDGMGQIVPLLGDLSKAFTNVTVTNSELLEEDPKKLAAAFPTLLGIAVGQVSGALKPIALPAVMGLKLKVVAIEPTDNQTFLSIFADLDLSMLETFRAETRGRVARLTVPPTEAFRVTSPGGLDPALAPRVELALDGSNIDGTAAGLEYSWSLDGGTWSPSSTSPWLEVSDPRLWLQGRHHVLVRARAVGQPATTDPTPLRLEFLIDTIAPTGTADVVGGELVLDGRDWVSPRAALEFRVDGGPWSRRDRMDLARIDTTRVKIEIRDEAGNIGEVNFHGRTTTTTAGGCSCAVAGRRDAAGGATGLALLGLGLGGLLVRRRIGRRGLARAVLATAAVATAALLGGGCSHDPPFMLSTADQLDPTDDIGRYSDAVARTGVIYLSAYDDRWGDLAFAVVPVADVAKPITWQWVDGVPLEGGVAEGYRRGNTDLGDDVGRYTSIAVTSLGDPLIAYHDVTHRQLKLARAALANRRWSSIVVDSVPKGVTGLYASLSLDDKGVPSIAYMVTGVAKGEGFVSRLRLATATSPVPAGPADWKTVDLDETPISCAGTGKTSLCATGSACVVTDVADHSKSVCKPTEALCMGVACPSGEACVSQACVAVLAPVSAPDLVEGTGLFAQLRRLKDGKRVVAYHDRSQGDLKLVVETGDNAFTKVLVDGNDPATDVGQFASAQVAPDDQVHIAYVDALADRLLYKTVKGTTATMTAEVIDDGQRTDGKHPVGGPAVWTDGTGVRVAYQDQTGVDLWVGTRTGGGWSKQAMAATARADGFYPHLVSDAGKLYATELVYDRSAMLEGKALGTLLILPVP